MRRKIAQKLAIIEYYKDNTLRYPFDKLDAEEQEDYFSKMLFLAEACLSEMAECFKIGYQQHGIDLVRSEPSPSTDEHLKLIGLLPE